MRYFSISRDSDPNAHPSYAALSNVPAPGQLWDNNNPCRMMLRLNELWHTDASYKRVPAKATVVSSAEVPPEKGETEFADLRAAWDNLPQPRKRMICDLTVLHDTFYSRAKVGFTDFAAADRAEIPPSAQPLVRYHPASGRTSLYREVTPRMLWAGRSMRVGPCSRCLPICYPAPLSVFSFLAQVRRAHLGQWLHRAPRPGRMTTSDTVVFRTALE